MIHDNKEHITYTAEYLQRYWKGELSPAEMHALEKAALDDPFLADALEGIGEAMNQYEEERINQPLHELHRHVTGKAPVQSTPVRAFRWWQVAAAALIILLAGFWIYTGTTEKENNALAVQDKQKEQQSAPAITPRVDSTSGGQPELSSPASEPATASALPPPPPPSETTRQREAHRQQATPGNDQASTQQRPVINERDTAAPIRIRGLGVAARTPEKIPDSAFAQKTTPDEELADKVPITEIVRVREETAQQRDQAFQQSQQEVKLQDFVKGVVMDHLNNPLPNAYVMVDNDANGVRTDLRGNFKIPVNNDTSTLRVSVTAVGYPTQRFVLRNAPGNDYASNQLRLQPALDKKGDYGVSAYGKARSAKQGTKESNSKPTVLVQHAQPVIGWKAYSEYLEKNNKLAPADTTTKGEVVISFMVNRKGVLSDFKVERGLSPRHDAEALRLVRTGPRWQLSSGRKSRVMVIVRF